MVVRRRLAVLHPRARALCSRVTKPQSPPQPCADLDNCPLYPSSKRASSPAAKTSKNLSLAVHIALLAALAVSALVSPRAWRRRPRQQPGPRLPSPQAHRAPTSDRKPTAAPTTQDPSTPRLPTRPSPPAVPTTAVPTTGLKPTGSRPGLASTAVPSETKPTAVPTAEASPRPCPLLRSSSPRGPDPESHRRRCPPRSSSPRRCPPRASSPPACRRPCPPRSSSPREPRPRAQADNRADDAGAELRAPTSRASRASRRPHALRLDEFPATYDAPAYNCSGI